MESPRRDIRQVRVVLRRAIIPCVLLVLAIVYVATKEYECRSTPIPRDEAVGLVVKMLSGQLNLHDAASIEADAQWSGDENAWHVSAMYGACEYRASVTQCEGVDVSGFNAACLPGE